MSDIWQRSFEEICNEANIVYSPTLAWKTLFRLVDKKWTPVGDLDDIKLGQLKRRTEEDFFAGRLTYLFDNSNCSFCQRAAHDSGSDEYKLSGGACDYCILEGKCFDEDWLIRTLFNNIIRGQYTQFRNNIRAGLRDIERIIERSRE